MIFILPLEIEINIYHTHKS